MLSILLRGWRSWKSAKGVALLAILALAVGIGSTTAIYTVVHAVLLNPFPYLHGERFVTLFGARFSEPGQFSGLSLPDIQDFQQRTRSFDVFGAFASLDFNLTAPGPPQLIPGVAVAPALANNIGVNPILGRWFGEPSSEHGDSNLAVISSGLWHRLGGSPGILGTRLMLNHQPYTVTGVMPGWFRLPVGGTGGEEIRSDVWVPLHPPAGESNRGYAAYFCYARRKPGVTLAQADADVKRAAAGIARDTPQFHAGFTAMVLSLQQSLVKEIRPTLLLLIAAAAALLLITCANVAGLLVSRSVARARETAIRVALGASRSQLALQFFVEGLMTALAGAAAGIFISYALVRFVLSLAADEIPRADEITVNWPVLGFALAVAILASLLFSLAPLWQAVRTLPNDVLTEGVRASAGARTRKLSRFLVVAEIALAFTLLAVGALLVAELANLARVAPGFNPDHVLTFRLNVPASQYPDLARLAGYQKQLVSSIERVPGVSSAAFSNQLPLAGCCYSFDIYPEGRSVDPTHLEAVSFMVTSPGYFRAMEIPLLSGRLYTGQEASEDTTAVIDQAAARRYWPGRDPVGQYAHASSPDGTRFRIAGVVGAVKNKSLHDATTPEVFFPNSLATLNAMFFVVRSPLPEQTLVPALRRAVQSVDPLQPIYAVQTMNDIVAASIARQRLQSFLISFFAAAALLMATLGVYGVVSYSVRQRTVEIGTRMAVGATSRDLIRLILGDGLKMAAFGIGIGALVIACVAVALRANLSGLRLDDPRPFLFSTGTVAGLTALACFAPAWRATLLSPMVAIRNDSGGLWRSTRENFKRIGGLVSRVDEQGATAESELLAAIADAGRTAATFPEALEAALNRLRDRVHAESIALFVQKADGQPYRCAAAIPGNTPGNTGAWSLPAASLLISRLRHYPGAMPLERADLDASARWAEENAPRHLPEIATIRDTGAALAARVAVRSEISGVLFLGHPVGRAHYSELDRRLVRGAAAQLATMLEISRLTDRISEQERLRRELALAGEVQKRLFPDRSPETANLQFAGICIPARGVGGDYYDFLDLGDRHLGVALADVAGKGIAAALIMSVVQASLRSLTGAPGGSLAEIAARLNRLLHRSTGSNSYATFFYAEVDEQRRSMRYVNAGHNPPYLLRGDGVIEELTTGGTIIGMFARSSYEEAAVRLQTGDVLLAFTDGVPEALDPQDEEFGEDRLKQYLRSATHLPVDDMAAGLLQKLQAWISDAAQYDDLTFILMKVN